MNTEYLIQLLENKLNVLTLNKDQSFLSGDIDRISVLEIEINAVSDTLYKLRLLLVASMAAIEAKTDLSMLMSAGVEAIKNGGIRLDDATKVLNEYDITSYATDPLHEAKIADILGLMGEMNSPTVIDAYINKEAIESPVTAMMILNACSLYVVDVRLTMAIMELDSRFGTAGVAVRTFNPGNVGNNDDGDIKTYSSWNDGVTAVAEWLSRHKKTPPVPVVVPIEEEPEVVPPIEEPATVPIEEEPEVVPPIEEPAVVTPIEEPVVVPPIEEPAVVTPIEEPVVVPPIEEPKPPEVVVTPTEISNTINTDNTSTTTPTIDVSTSTPR